MQYVLSHHLICITSHVFLKDDIFLNVDNIILNNRTK